MAESGPEVSSEVLTANEATTNGVIGSVTSAMWIFREAVSTTK
jgi:hypothetical protein